MALLAALLSTEAGPALATACECARDCKGVRGDAAALLCVAKASNATSECAESCAACHPIVPSAMTTEVSCSSEKQESLSFAQTMVVHKIESRYRVFSPPIVLSLIHI